MKAIYLDNNATTRLDPMVLEAMMPFMTEHYGNPSSIHGFGEPVRKALEAARHQVATLLGAEHDSEIVFTSCATEANSTVLLSAVEALPDRKQIITTVVEHPAILEVCEHLERQGYQIHRLAVDGQGRLDLDAYAALLSDQVALVSVMWANNETGTLFPVLEMAQMAKAHGILFHTDGVQAVGKLPINLATSAIDLLSFSGHKLHGPKGVGALYVRRGTRFRPLLRGGHQERGRRAGTENSAGIIGSPAGVLPGMTGGPKRPIRSSASRRNISCSRADWLSRLAAALPPAGCAATPADWAAGRLASSACCRASKALFDRLAGCSRAVAGLSGEVTIAGCAVSIPARSRKSFNSA